MSNEEFFDTLDIDSKNDIEKRTIELVIEISDQIKKSEEGIFPMLISTISTNIAVYEKRFALMENEILELKNKI